MLTKGTGWITPKQVTRKLTKRQQTVLTHVREVVARDGVFPLNRAIAEATGYPDRDVTMILLSLSEMGYVQPKGYTSPAKGVQRIQWELGGRK